MNSSASARPSPRETPVMRMVFADMIFYPQITQIFADLYFPSASIREICGCSTSWIKFGFARELFPQFFLRVGNFTRHNDFCGDNQIAGLAKAASAHTEFLSAGGAGGNLD